jgi:PIN domain nuclease of toxin-antitoxin system
MKYLIDAHALIWLKQTDPRMSDTAIRILEDKNVELHISHAVMWELIIKESLGRLEIPGRVAGLYEDWITTGAAELIHIRWPHIEKAGQLPHIHEDPFDRMLVAQALVEKMDILTNDPHIAKYPGIKAVW